MGCGVSAEIRKEDGEVAPLTADGSEADREALMEQLREFPMNYENLVLEGGGTKTYAYLGALKVLEDLDALKNIKRFAGTSGGAVVSAMLALGSDVNGLYRFFDRSFQQVSADASCGLLSALPNVLNKYGWHPGKRLVEHLKQWINDLCGNPDITFKELYETKGRELCICATNVSQMALEYFHVKTTPDVPIVVALRMSSSLPGYFQPVRYEGKGASGLYVDGGVLCNYPIFVFDGWYLSMHPKDSFLSNLGTDRPPFEGHNPLTLGMLVYSAFEYEMLRSDLHKRYQNFQPNRPDTKLARQRQKATARQLDHLQQRNKLVEAAQSLAKALGQSDRNADNCISLDEFRDAMTKVEQEDVNLLFGGQLNVEQIFNTLDKDGDGSVRFCELAHFLDQKGIAVREIIQGSVPHQNIKGVGRFFSALVETMRITVKSYHIKQSDLQRTIGVHTDYIDTTDFGLADEDRLFLLRQGENVVIAFLKELKDRQQKNSAKT